jgi:hypothetical protein
MGNPAIAKVLRDIIDFVAHDKDARLLFANAGTERGRLAFLAVIDGIVTNTAIRSFKVSIYPMYPYLALTLGIKKDPPTIDWIARLGDVCSARHSNVPECLKQANDDRRKQLGHRKSAKKRFSQSLGFTTRARAASATKLANLPKIFLKRFTNKKAYPPLKTWVFETPAIGKRWRRHLKYGRQADKRRRRLPMMQVDARRLAHDVVVTESGTYHDSKDGHLFCLVVREFCPNGDVCAAVHEVVREAVSERRNVRVCCSTFSLSFSFH